MAEKDKKASAEVQGTSDPQEITWRIVDLERQLAEVTSSRDEAVAARERLSRELDAAVEHHDRALSEAEERRRDELAAQEQRFKAVWDQRERDIERALAEKSAVATKVPPTKRYADATFRAKVKVGGKVEEREFVPGDEVPEGTDLTGLPDFATVLR